MQILSSGIVYNNYEECGLCEISKDARRMHEANIKCIELCERKQIFI